VLNSSDEKFHENLKKVATQYNCTLAFDAVAGDLTGQILNAMPEGLLAIII
jgi:NADPH2:quinone reductase